MRPILALVLMLISTISSAATEKFNEILATPSLLQQLQQGGLVIYMRHSKTDNNRPDRAPAVDLADCNTQRPLSDEGRELAKKVGAFVKQANFPYDTPISSPMCRAKETAELAYGHYITDMGLTYSGSMTSSEKMPVLARTKALLGELVAAGHNRLLVAHAPNLMDIMGYFPKEGTLVIFKPEGNSQYTYLGSIPPDYWPKLLSP